MHTYTHTHTHTWKKHRKRRQSTTTTTKKHSQQSENPNANRNCGYIRNQPRSNSTNTNIWTSVTNSSHQKEIWYIAKYAGHHTRNDRLYTKYKRCHTQERINTTRAITVRGKNISQKTTQKNFCRYHLPHKYYQNWKRTSNSIGHVLLSRTIQSID